MPDTNSRRINADFFDDTSQDLWLREEDRQDSSKPIYRSYGYTENACFEGHPKTRADKHNCNPKRERK